MGKSAPSSWPQRTILYLIGLYQRHISAHTPPSCRFTPTCSQYASEAIKRYGVWRGGRLALWRLCRCQPFCRGGYDPVPELKEPEPVEPEETHDNHADEN